MKTVRLKEDHCTALVLSASHVLREVVAEFLMESEAPVQEVLCASNESEALYFIQTAQVDIMITDRPPEWACSAVTLVVGPPAIGRIQQSLDRGAAGYLVKPFSQESLVREVGYALQTVAA